MKYNILQEETFGKSLKDIVLINRELIDDDVEFLLNPTNEYQEMPLRIRNMDKAMELFINELDNESKIGLLVDTDTDGYMSSGLMYLFLTNECQIEKDKIEVFFHNGKQHGLSDVDIFKKIKKSDIDFLIIPDAGTNDIKEIKELMKLGKRILVLDHHILENNEQSTLFYDQNNGLIGVISNNQLNEYSNNLCGTGVVYRFINALTEDEMEHYMDMVAIAQIADSMLLNDFEVRYIVHKGLKNITNPLIKEYLEDFDLENIVPMDISFNVANYINGTIRFGTNEEKEDLFRALIGEQEEREYKPRKSKTNPNPQVEMQTLQKAMVRISKSIKTKQDTAKKKCIQLCKDYIEENNINDNKVIVVIDEENKIIDKRITGLVAMGLVDVYKKSVIILSKSSKEGKFIGSMRAYGVEDFKSILESTEIMKVIGHKGSAGVEVENKDLPRLIKRINKVMENVDTVTPLVEVDCEINISDLKDKSMNEIIQMRPIWHQHCQAPLFLIKNYELDTKKVRSPYATLMIFPIGNYECRKEFCSKVFKESFLHEKEVRFGKPILTCDLLVEIGYDEYKKKPCFILRDAETNILDKKRKPTKDCPF